MSAGPATPSRAAVPVPAGAVPALALYEVDADVVAALVLACPAVAGLSGGPFGAAATYLPGRCVTGVRIGPDAVEVHVVARHGPGVLELARQVRRALVDVVRGRAVDVVVEDISGPGLEGLGPATDTPTGGPAGTATSTTASSSPAGVLPPPAAGWSTATSAPL